MNNDELKPTRVPAPPPSLGQLSEDQLPGEGRLPMHRGTVGMSNYTRTQLEKLGWKVGDPIPGDLGLRLQEVQSEIQKERDGAKLEDSDLAVGYRPPKQKFVNIDDLEPGHQAELRKYLKEYKAEVLQAKAVADAQAAVDAQIPECVQGDMRDLTRKQIIDGQAAEARRQGMEPQAEVIDDRATAAPPADDGGQPESLAEKMEKAKEQTEAASTAQQAPSEEPATSGVKVELTSCPRCMWPLDQPFTTQPTTEDKQAFLVSILGTSRFQKRYELLGGNVVVYLRSLATSEVAMIQQQLGQDIRNGSIHGDGEFISWLLEYRLTISVSQIDVGGNTFMLIPPIDKWAEENPAPPAEETEAEKAADQAFNAYDTKVATPLPRMREWFYREVTPQESLRRIVGEKHREFQRLVEALEVMTSDSSFWIGIELPGS